MKTLKIKRCLKKTMQYHLPTENKSSSIFIILKKYLNNFFKCYSYVYII